MLPYIYRPLHSPCWLLGVCRLLGCCMPGFSVASCMMEAEPGAKAACARRVVGALWPHTMCYTLEVRGCMRLRLGHPLHTCTGAERL